MKVTFLGHGLESKSENSIGNYLSRFLRSTEFDSFTAISAFASQFAIKGLSKDINEAKKYFKTLSIIVGIDQEGTSTEALEAILHLDINSYIFYQAESAIFHPKIYLFEGTNNTKIIIGSSNLTGRGLFVNVECSVLIEFTNEDNDGKEFIDDLKGYYNNLLDFTDCNLFKITMDIIEKFSAVGILPKESIRKDKYGKKTGSVNDNLLIEIRKRPIAKIPSTFFEKDRIDFNIDHLLKNIPNEIEDLFYALKDNICALDKNIKLNTNAKKYIGFTTSQIFAEVRLQMKNIRVVLLKVDYSDFINDVEPVPRSHGWGNKGIKIYINDNDKLIRMMPLIERSYYSTK